MRQPDLDEVPLDTVMVALFHGKPSLNITMSQGQWDGFLQEAYDAGFYLIEVNENEIPIRAYQKKMDSMR